MTTPGAVIEKAANACIGALLLAGTMDDATATAGMTLNALVGLGIGFRRRRPRSCDHIREGIRTAIDQRFPGLAESPEYTEHWENARARLDDAVQVSVPSLETLARASFTTEELSAALARSILNNLPLEAEDRENHTTAFKIIDVAVRAGVDAALASADFREQLAKEMVLALPVNIARQTELLAQILSLLEHPERTDHKPQISFPSRCYWRFRPDSNGNAGEWRENEQIIIRFSFYVNTFASGARLYKIDVKRILEGRHMPMFNNSLHQRISCTIKLPKGSHQSMIDEPIDLQGGAELSTPVCLPPNHSRRFTYWARFGRPARFNSELHEFPGETRISITLLDERDENLITSCFLARDSDIGFVDEVEQLH